jgi:hypothetical protein
MGLHTSAFIPPVGHESSLVTQMFIAEKYGLRLNVNQLADLLGIAPGTVLNRISCNTFNIPTYLDNGKRYADFRDVAAHFDRSRNNAA